MKWSLAAQLRLGLAASLLLVFGVCGAAWWVALDYRDEINVTHRTQMLTTVQLAEAESALWQLRYGFPQFMIGSAEDQHQILGEQDKWYAIIEGRLAAYRETTRDADERRALTSLRSAYLRYKQARPKFFELWAAGDKDEAIAWRALTTTPFGVETVQAFAAQIELQRSVAERDQAEAGAKVRVALVLVTAITMALLAMLVIAYVYSVRLLRPIRALKAQAERVVHEQLGESIDPLASSNEVTALVESFQLMSERLLARTGSLREARERLDFLLRATPAVIYSAQPHGDYAVTFVSVNVRAILGYEPEEFLSDPGFWASHIHPDDRERVFAGLAVLETQDTHAYDYRYRHKDCSWRWMCDEFTLIRDSSGAPHELVGYWIDITERKRAQEMQARLAAIVETATVAIFTRALDGTILTWNPGAEKMLGYTAAEAIGRPIAFTLPPDRPPNLARNNESLLRGESEARESDRITKDGRVINVLTSHSPIRDGAGNIVAASVILQDITARKQAEEKLVAFAADLEAKVASRTQELAIALEAATESDRMKTEFMANVTHELRTPLNSVIGFAELLKDEVPGPLNAKQAAFTADILASGRSLLALVEGILEMSRVDAAGAALEREPVAIGAALAERVAAHRRAAEARRVSIVLEGAADAGRAELDPKALRRMLDALLDNAIKFNREGGAVAVRAQRVGEVLEIAVADMGIGISREELAQLFKPFVQLDAGLVRKHGGVGLGLALARRLAELHGGSIGVESEPGKGSTFTLRLPAGGKP